MFKPKIAKDDYEKSMLPSTRKAQFADILKLNWGKLLVLGLIVLLFTLPIHLFAIGEDLYQTSIMHSLPSSPSEEEIALALGSILNFNYLRNLINIPLFVIASLSLAGVSRVLRQMIWGEGFTLFGDFFKGIKQNWGQFIIIGLIAGILNFIAIFIENLASTINGEVYQYLSILPKVVFILLLAPIAGYAQVSICCYSNKFKDNLKIGRVCYFSNFFKTLLALLISILPFMVSIIPNFWCHVLGRLISTLLVAIIYLGWMLFASIQLDKVVNKKFHPELVNKGLYIENEIMQ